MTAQPLTRPEREGIRAFFAWRDRPVSAQARRDQQLRVLVRASHEATSKDLCLHWYVWLGCWGLRRPYWRCRPKTGACGPARSAPAGIRA